MIFYNSLHFSNQANSRSTEIIDVCEESKDFSIIDHEIVEPEHRGERIEAAQIVVNGDFEGSDQGKTSSRDSKSQAINETGEISVSSDINKKPIEPKTSYQSHTMLEAMLEGPRQPKLWKFPVRDPKSRKTKCFHVSWYLQFPWLEYDVEKDDAFCYCCTKFSSITSSLCAALTFTQTGYTNWANALDSSKGFQQHEKSELHKNIYARWMELKKIQEGKQKDMS